MTVSSIEAGGPADRGGLQAGDIILAIDGATVTAADDLDPHPDRRQDRPPVTLAILRSGERRTVSLTPKSGRGKARRDHFADLAGRQAGAAAAEPRKAANHFRSNSDKMAPT